MSRALACQPPVPAFPHLPGCVCEEAYKSRRVGRTDSGAYSAAVRAKHRVLVVPVSFNLPVGAPMPPAPPPASGVPKQDTCGGLAAFAPQLAAEIVSRLGEGQVLLGVSDWGWCSVPPGLALGHTESTTTVPAANSLEIQGSVMRAPQNSLAVPNLIAAHAATAACRCSA